MIGSRHYKKITRFSSSVINLQHGPVMKGCERGTFFNLRYTKGLPFLSKWKEIV